MITDKERLEWCESILFDAAGRGNTGWLVTGTGCGCCGDGISIIEGVSFRDAVDAQILQGTSRKNCLNHGWLLAKAGLGSEARDAFNQAHEAMRRMVPIYQETGSLRFVSGVDEKAVEDAIGIWVEQLKLITLGELQAAMQVVEANYWKHREAA